MVTPELDYPTIKVRLNKLLLELMSRIDQVDGFKLSVPTALPGPKPVLGYPDLSSSSEKLKKVADGLLVQLDEDRILAQLNEDGAFSELETSNSREPLLRSYKSFYATLRAYAHAHFKNNTQDKADLNDKAELDIVRYKNLIKDDNTRSPVFSSPPTNAQPKDEGMLFSELLKQYIETKLSDNAISESSAIDYRNRLENFIDIAGDMPLTKINRQKVRNFRDTLSKLPPNRKKDTRYKGKEIKEILSMPVEKTVSIRTVNEITHAVSAIFEWAMREGIHTDNPAKGLKIKDTTPDVEKRDPFRKTDIRKIFTDTKYLEDKHKHPAYFWCPLIALYTGMRLEEIAQLHRADIYEHKDENEPIWVIDIREESASGNTTDKKLKNRNARRIIPIHNDLIEIGLIDFHKRQQKRQTRLFPELNKSKRGGKYGKQVGKQFSALLNRIGIKTKKKTFHSLRHTFRDYFKKKDISNLIFAEVFGHASSEAAATRGYGSAFSPIQKRDKVIIPPAKPGA